MGCGWYNSKRVENGKRNKKCLFYRGDFGSVRGEAKML